jgi:hypothetical protein
MTSKTKEIFETIYKVFVVLTLLYVTLEISDLKALALKNKTEINYVTSKLDYVTSDINIRNASFRDY